jgi:hypothetical protein
VAAAILVVGCGGAPLTVDTSGGAAGAPSAMAPAEGATSTVDTPGAAGAPNATGAAGAPNATGAAGGTASSDASPAPGADLVETIYDVPEGGVLACGATPTTHTVAGMPVGSGSATGSDGKCVPGAYVRNGLCACQAGLPTVCGGTCVDTSLDVNNCGACGRTCGPTSTCIAGACGPPVTNVVPPAPGCVSLNVATSGGILYWTDQGHGTVRSQPLAGCAATTIVSGEQSPTLLTTDGVTLVWVTGPAGTDSSHGSPITTTATLRALSLPDGTPRDLATESNMTGGIRGLVLSADGQTVYYSADTRVRAVPVAGGPAFDVGHEEHGGIPTALARDGNLIAYITELNGNVDAITVEDGVVASCGGPDASGNFVGKNCARIFGCNPEAFLGGLVLRGERAYWSDGDIQGGSFTGGFKDFSVSGDYPDGTSGLTGASDSFYFASTDPYSFPPGDTARGMIYRAPYGAGSTAVAIARGQNVPSSLAVAGSTIYWATADCAINSVPR